MDNFNKTWTFGMLGGVTLNSDQSVWEEYDYLPKMTDFELVFKGKPYQVIGEVKPWSGLVKFNDEEKIYAVIELEKLELRCAANNLTSLMNFLDSVDLLWINYENDASLPATKENVDYATRIINTFALENPDADTDFWEFQCFSGLNYRFEI
ncbi:MAG: hypothetical protein RL264_648 [Bacteroidota bacterium]|jgi:hypothetical protein